MSIVPGLEDLILIRLTKEDVRIIETHGCPDEAFMAALEQARPTEEGILLGCRRECLIDVNCVLAAVSYEIEDPSELSALLNTYDKIEPYEFGE